jgi:hypothetical protein
MPTERSQHTPMVMHLYASWFGFAVHSRKRDGDGHGNSPIQQHGHTSKTMCYGVRALRVTKRILLSTFTYLARFHL